MSSEPIVKDFTIKPTGQGMAELRVEFTEEFPDLNDSWHTSVGDLPGQGSKMMSTVDAILTHVKKAGLCCVKDNLPVWIGKNARVFDPELGQHVAVVHSFKENRNSFMSSNPSKILTFKFKGHECIFAISQTSKQQLDKLSDSLTKFLASDVSKRPPLRNN